MDHRVKAALLWGVVGGLAFLVLVQGYELLAKQGVAALVKVGVAVVVGVVAGVASYRLRPRIAARNEQA